MIEEKVSLYKKDERSDKEYHVQLIKAAELWSVKYQNGRRGGTLASGNRTPAPVAYEVAKKKYDSVVKEKLRDGYTPGETGTPFVGGELEKRFTGILGQLLNPVSEEASRKYVCDPDWILQEKEDGNRILTKWTSGEALGINRKGLSTAMPLPVVQALSVLSKAEECAFCEAVLDGELIGSVYVIFDILELDGTNLRQEPLLHRLAVLERFRKGTTAHGLANVRISVTSFTEEEKRNRLAELRKRNAEGAVFKLLSSKYVPGRPASGGEQLKLKFTKDATVRVCKLHATKRSLHMEVMDDQGVWTEVGKCLIPSNKPIPMVGELIDVNYLYAFPGGSLFQPIFKGARDDLDESACTMAQLQYKAGTKEDDEEDLQAD